MMVFGRLTLVLCVGCLLIADADAAKSKGKSKKHKAKKPGPTDEELTDGIVPDVVYSYGGGSPKDITVEFENDLVMKMGGIYTPTQGRCWVVTGRP
jgi:hypothetical protein